MMDVVLQTISQPFKAKAEKINTEYSNYYLH